MVQSELIEREIIILILIILIYFNGNVKFTENFFTLQVILYH